MLSTYTQNLLDAISGLNAELKYLPLLTGEELDALIVALETVYARLDREKTTRVLNVVRKTR